jgi:hypothetical protein
VVRPLQAYIRRPLHGEKGDIVKHQTYDLIREISLKHHHFVCGLFEKGSGQRDLGEAAAPTSMAVSISLCFH